MVKEVQKVVWDYEASLQMRSVYEYIKVDSLRNANKVRNDIVALARKLPSHPDSYPPDKYKRDNDGSFKAFEKHHYRIA